MASFYGTIHSKALKMDTALSVLLPADIQNSPDSISPARVLILLHGLSDNASAWMRFSSIERYARRYNLVVVMPEAQRSFYHNMPVGPAYESYIAEELPVLLSKMFHVSQNRDDRFIAGLSMGGYGALWCALRHPDVFAHCASFSGVIDPCNMELSEEQFLLSGDPRNELLVIAGDMPTEALSIKSTFEKAYADKYLPDFFMTCGSNDFLYGQNKAFAEELSKLEDVHLFYREWPGTHNWEFWDASIDLMLRYYLHDGDFAPSDVSKIAKPILNECH